MLIFKSFLTRLLLVAGLGLMPVWAMAQQATTPAAPTAAATPAADAKTIKAGSIIQLNSGGPKMTVVALVDSVVRAQWYNTNNHIYITADFPLYAVKIATDDDEDEDDDEEEEEDEDEDE